ncbi:hypothetical protein PF010_g6521 [Phytophthora fragariae]|uniref:Uncharacterized protein n=1 Tax=Phytophthora fragariae TaxID=53985 RepID=A0A6A3T1B0_9STRA|nr:hypothetical protein PF009_g8801 [Phytophthora fragariae]KAE9122188.1 hypothetical protein PF007_g7540 [Phytophthora fragariae]KAE9123107.1 hypothetical protein PF010_g6521 [Phytophthora fragariae]
MAFTVMALYLGMFLRDLLKVDDLKDQIEGPSLLCTSRRATASTRTTSCATCSTMT